MRLVNTSWTTRLWVQIYWECVNPHFLFCLKGCICKLTNNKKCNLYVWLGIWSKNSLKPIPSPYLFISLAPALLPPALYYFADQANCIVVQMHILKSYNTFLAVAWPSFLFLMLRISYFSTLDTYNFIFFDWFMRLIFIW